jgi:uncharacterized protein YecT (DUF1311 family)
MRLALAAVALAAVQAAPAAAQSPPAYYCDPLHVYYPAVARCPVPWRAVYPAPAAPQPYWAQPPRSQGPVPSMPQSGPPIAGNGVPMLGDNLDQWCSQVKLPSSVAICSDRELRALAIERQDAFDAAKARLSPDQQKALLADQNGWVRTYPRTCGLTDAPPSLPLAPAIKDCMAEAGRARIAYLRDYGASEATTSATTAPAANAGSVYRCRDPKTNFDYERLQPCATGDITLAAPVSRLAPAAAAIPSGSNSSAISAREETDDPLMGLRNRMLLQRAIDLCAKRDIKVAARDCSDGPLKLNPEQVSECAKTLAASYEKECPDGPEKLAADWEARRRADTITFREFVLDKEQMAQPVGEYGTRKMVEIRGVYIRASDNMDYLLAPGKISPMAYGENLNSDNAVPLLIVDGGRFETDRATRANLLACRQRHPPETFAGCSVLLDGFVQKCNITIFLTGASHGEVCINVSEAIIDPRS